MAAPNRSLEAAATAMYLGTGEITARGPLAHLFRAQAYVPVPPGDPPDGARS
ncbi:hypothetical protein [Micromonospora sp. NPDC005806]|uniref:hypothetical protein n=1 Tax=Micromonospora sp. NPDC005806 TaxID=3364234 RepID=UPI0036A23E0B